MHHYTQDAQSGAGNCDCGRAEYHRTHWHVHRPAWRRITRCVCGEPPWAPCHVERKEDQDQ